jgi:hypothetical protein
VTSSTTRTGATTSAKRSGRRRCVSEAGSDQGTSRARDRWQKSASQMAKVDRGVCEERLADLRQTLNAPAWAAAVAALRQERGKA